MTRSQGGGDLSQHKGGNLSQRLRIREFLKDKHERTKDTNYRNKHEEQKMILENKILKLDIISKKISVLKEAGVNGYDCDKFMSNLIVKPLMQIDISLEDQLINNVKIKKLNKKKQIG